MAHQLTFSFTPIEVPGADNTNPRGINDAGVIVGQYSDSAGSQHSFADVRGEFFTIDPPGAVPSPIDGVVVSQANGINNAGQIVGEFTGTDQAHGYINTFGQFTQIDVPGATFTEALDINNRGQVVGDYIDSAGFHGFLYDKGTITPIDLPNSTETVTTAINDKGQIAGFFRDSAGHLDGFLLDHGDLTTVAPAGSINTQVYGINNEGQIAGYDQNSHLSFIYDAGHFETFSVPGAEEGLTQVRGINDLGEIVGTSFSPSGHGFLGVPDHKADHHQRPAFGMMDHHDAMVPTILPQA